MQHENSVNLTKPANRQLNQYGKAIPQKPLVPKTPEFLNVHLKEKNKPGKSAIKNPLTLVPIHKKSGYLPHEVNRRTDPGSY